MRYRLGDTPFGGTFDTYRGIRRFQRMVIQTLLHNPPSMVYCHDADTLRVGTALKKSHQIPFVFDMHDLQHTWVRYPAPQSILRTFASGRMKQRMLKRAKLASAIITSSGQVSDEGHRGFLQWLRHHGLDGTVVENINIVTKVNNDDTIAYPYLYNDPEMELWFQKHCRTWGFKELYI